MQMLPECPKATLPEGGRYLPYNCALTFTGRNPRFMIFPTPPPNGAVHTPPLGAVVFPLAVTMGRDSRYRPWACCLPRLGMSSAS